MSATVFEDARKRLLATELFNNVSDSYMYVGTPLKYDLLVEVVENDQVFPLRFERLPVPDTDLKQYLREHVVLYSEQIPGTQGVLNRYIAAIQERVATVDPNAKIAAHVSNDDPKQLAVLFTPKTPAPTISQVKITGNTAVDTGTLLRAVNHVAIGVPYSEMRLQQILDGTVRRLYAAKGLMNVTFPKIEAEKAPTNLGYIVNIDIKEGPVYKVGPIRFRGSGLDQEEIRANIPFKVGMTYNGDLVESFSHDLAHRMKMRGFLDVQITPDPQVDEEKRTVNLTYNVLSGSAYKFGSLDISGLDLVSEPVIRKLWGEKPGQPFNPEYPDFFLKRVGEQGLFDNLNDTRSDYSADPASHNVTVHLYFKGGKPKEEKKRKPEEESTPGPIGLPPIGF